MSLVNTTILTFDNQTLIVPNNSIWQNVIKNVTAQTQRRVDMIFGIGYSDDIAKAQPNKVAPVPLSSWPGSHPHPRSREQALQGRARPRGGRAI